MTKVSKNINYILCGFLAFFILMALFVPAFDHSVSSFILDIRTSFLTDFFKVITVIGEPETITIIAVIALIIFNKKKDRCFIVFNSLGIWLVNILTKYIIERPRPNISLIEETNYSFPSGHAMVCTALLGLLLILFCRKIKSKGMKYFLAIVVALIVLLIAFSRIYLGVHYYTDVMCGLLISLIIINIEKKYL